MSFLDAFSGLTGQMSTDMAIDLGTANTLVAVTGEGIVINEPSVVAIEKSTHRVLAVGHEAKNMINHTPEAFSAEHPLKDGVIADYDVTEAMLSAFINKAAVRKYPWQAKPRIVICIPCGATSVEKRAVFEAAIQAGARQAYLIEEPMAAAMGADLPVTEPTGSMVVDIGGGTTEVAVISLGGIVTSSSLRLAGNRMDEAIAMHLRDLLGIKIGERTAEVIKIKIGSILPFEDGRERDMIISGQDVYTEQPKEVTIQSEDVRAALQAPIEEMVPVSYTHLGHPRAGEGQLRRARGQALLRRADRVHHLRPRGEDGRLRRGRRGDVYKRQRPRRARGGRSAARSSRRPPHWRRAGRGCGRWFGRLPESCLLYTSDGQLRVAG